MNSLTTDENVGLLKKKNWCYELRVGILLMGVRNVCKISFTRFLHVGNIQYMLCNIFIQLCTS